MQTAKLDAVFQSTKPFLCFFYSWAFKKALESLACRLTGQWAELSWATIMRFSCRWGAPRPALLLPPLKPNPLDPLCFSYWNQLHCFKGWRWDQGSSFIISLSLLGGKRRYSLSPVNLAETKAIWLSALQLFLVLLLKNEWVQLLVWLLYIDFFSSLVWIKEKN